MSYRKLLLAIRTMSGEWNLLTIDVPTSLGMEVAKANPFRYVGKFGVQ
ncbi:hypothetical protein ACOI1C_21535 [Bacillus sp. DJP31]